MPTRTTHLSATVNGHAVTRILSARCTYSWKINLPEATIYVPAAPQNVATWQASHAYGLGAYVKPTSRNGHTYRVAAAGTSGGSQPTWPTTNDATVTNGGVTFQEAGLDIVYDDEIAITMGAGNNIVRFKGVFRKFSFALFPRAVGLLCRGYLVRADEHINNEGPTWQGGLALSDLLSGPTSGTDEAIVIAVLGRTNIDSSLYTGNIQGTGVTWGLRSDIHNSQYVWRAGYTGPSQLQFTGAMGGAIGQSALDYIQNWDKVSAQYSGPTDPVGFYRTYETVNGIFRSLIGGRPRGSIDLTFSEGVDIEATATSGREYPLANAAYVEGGDFGLDGAHPARNVDDTGTFLGQSSNPFQPDTLPITSQFASSYIEYSTEAETIAAGHGMSCEIVGYALLADLNRETVTARFRTPRDDLITPGMTILVQGPGGQPDRLGVGEPLWVDSVSTEVDDRGVFTQDVEGTGGGLPDDDTPAPDW